MCNGCGADSYPRIDRRDFLKLSGAGLAGAALLGATGSAGAARGPSLRAEIAAASREYGVPKELLLAMGYYNTLWEMPEPEASDYEKGSLHGRGDYGIMQLTRNPFRDSLGRAAALAGLSEEEVEKDRAANVRAGAALLADIAGKTKPADLDGWREVVAEYFDYEPYAGEIFDVLKGGAALRNSTGERLALSSQSVATPRSYEFQAAGADYPRARWVSAHSNNYTKSSRERSYNITRIVVHVAQGSFGTTLRWFQNPNASVSAHYTVARDGRVAQSVRNKDIAWHAGHWRTNCQSIGIEHAGYVNNPDYFTRRMYRASARLAAWCCKRHRIPVDRKHIIGHNQVPGCPGPGGGSGCHTDPGKHWNWKRYIRLVRYYRRRL